jgi:UDP-N-acetylmuramoyl-tripeptide--D-alanyl-D-alanine ligase
VIDLAIFTSVVVGAGAWSGVVGRQVEQLLHLLQLEEYELARFWRWLHADPRRAMPPAQLHGALALMGLAAAVRILGLPWLVILTGPLAVATAVYVARQQPPVETKKPLVRTPKILVLWVVIGLLVLLTMAPGAAALAPLPLPSGSWVFALYPLGLGLMGLLPPVYVTLATAAVYPFQAAAKWSIAQFGAVRLRRRRDLIVIGITGSYGKTTTKEILATLLGARYRVRKTTGSVNTPVGIARTVLRGLRPDDQVFVVEMGAYVPGNIRQLARLMRPRIGVLTAIGEQHLERFGSVDKIAATKYELIEALPPDGLAVFNADNARCRDLAARTRHVPVRTYGLEATPGPPDLTAVNIRTSTRGTEFTVRAAGRGEARFRTPLLGRHNVANVLGATAVALELGLSLEEIAQAAARLEPVAHRLQLVVGSGGVTVIDDAYNSNPAGAQAALDVLAEFPGRKVLVTPGMVELGEMLEERHTEFGRAAAAVCDYVILVGPGRTRSIAAGALAAGLARERLFVVPSLKEATARLGRLVKAGDVVLFENDLPDQYSES